MQGAVFFSSFLCSQHLMMETLVKGQQHQGVPQPEVPYKANLLCSCLILGNEADRLCIPYLKHSGTEVHLIDFGILT